MEEDQAICRVCRCESTLTKPLYHPCKCTGSIRFIHQDCLLEWLAHSKKGYCELCEHSFVFTPIYRQDMPVRIPLYLVIGQCLLRFGTSLKLGLRGLAVGIVCVNIDGWHLDETRLSSQPHQHLVYDSDYGVWEFLIDCFKGQLITTGLVLVVAAAYIFKEWMAQNVPLEEQDSDMEQEFDTHLPKHEDGGQQPQNYHISTEDDNDTLSVLIRQQTAVDALMEALEQVGDNDQSSKDGDGNNLKKQLEDLHRDLQQEIEKTQQSRHQEHRDRQGDQQQHHSHHQLDNINQTNTAANVKGWMNSDLFQLNTDDDDETQVENMMQSIMIQDPAKTPMRYSWDDLQNNSNSNRNDKQQQQSLYHKHDSLESSLLLSNSQTTGSLDIKVPSPFSRNEQLLENMLLSRPTVGIDLLTESSPIYNNLQQQQRQQQQQNTDTSASKSESSSTRKNNYHQNDDILNNIFSRSKLSTTFTYEPSLISHQTQQPEPSIFEKESQLAQQHRQDVLMDNSQQHQAQQVDTYEDTTDDEDDIEDGIFNLGDDIDGVLEAIGMRGNPWVLLQNSIFAFIIISCCLGVAVCIPYLVGRLIIMIRPLRFIEKMISTLQYVTDPLVDYALDHWCPLMELSTFLDFFTPDHGVWWSSLLKNSSNGVISSSSSASPLFLKGFQFSTPVKNIVNANNNDTSTTTATFSFYPSSTNQQALAIPEMKKYLHAVSGKIIDRWHQFAVGQTGLDRGVCTIIGYLALLCIGSWYLACRRHYNTANGRRQQGAAGNNMVQQFWVFVKVISFIFSEFVFLPIFCGGLLNVVVMSLLEQGDTVSWMFNSIWSCFLHWCVGTCFIYETAVFLSLCRGTVRPGLMWFIRDRNDPNYQPFQEAMDRPLFGLLQKLCVTTLIYLILIVGGVGSMIWTVTQYTDIQQIRWTFSEPLFSVATDILAAQCLLPILVAFIKPRDTFKQTLSLWWHAMAHQLRLSSFMFGERYPREEGVYIDQSWLSWMTSFLVPMETSDMAVDGIDGDDSPCNVLQMDGMFARVPHQDTVHPQQRMIIPVDHFTFEPINEFEKVLGDSAANEQNSTEYDNTVVVYLPPYFKTRVILFLISMWLCGSAMVCSLTFGPLLLGRFLLEEWVAPGKQLHDLYPYVLGVCVMTLSTNTIRSVAQGTHYILKHDTGHDGLLIDLLDKLSACVRQKILNGCKLLYLTFFIGWVIPLLTGLATDLYLFVPFRSNIPSSQLALTTLGPFDHWNSGLVYLVVIYRLASILPANTWQRGMDQYMSGGLSSLDLWNLTRTILAPCIIAIASAIIIPGGSVWIVLHLLAVQDASMKLWLLQYVYIGVLSMIAIFTVVILGMKLLNLWMRVVRDDTYLIGKQLHNLDDSTY